MSLKQENHIIQKQQISANENKNEKQQAENGVSNQEKCQSMWVTM